MKENTKKSKYIKYYIIFTYYDYKKKIRKISSIYQYFQKYLFIVYLCIFMHDFINNLYSIPYIMNCFQLIYNASNVSLFLSI